MKKILLKNLKELLLVFIIVGLIASLIIININKKTTNLDSNETKVNESENSKVIETIDTNKILNKYTQEKVKVEYSNEISTFDFATIDLTNGGVINSIKYDKKTYTVSGIKEKVKQVLVGPANDGTTIKIVLLMENGTIQIYDLLDSIKNTNNINFSNKSLDKFTNITKIFQVATHIIIDENGSEYTRVTFIGQDKDGNYYDLLVN